MQVSECRQRYPSRHHHDSHHVGVPSPRTAPPLPAPGSHCSAFCHHDFASVRTSDTWDHMARGLLRLAASHLAQCRREPARATRRGCLHPDTPRFPSSVTPCRTDTLQFITSPVDGIWILSGFWLLCIKLMVFVWPCALFFVLGKHLGVGLPGPLPSLRLPREDAAVPFSDAVVPAFTSPGRM